MYWSNDLKTVTDEMYDGATWQPLGTWYYRYYTSDSSIGFVHGLQHVVGPITARAQSYPMPPEPINPEIAPR